MRMIPIARKTAHNLAMIRYPTYIITLTLALLLAACIPIPATPPAIAAALPAPTPDPAAGPRAGFPDLASGLAKADDSDDIQKYSQLLDEFNACMQADMTSGENPPKFSDSEIVAVSIYFAGVLSMAQLFNQAFEDISTENATANEQPEKEPSAFDMLAMALTACLQIESE